MRSDIDTIEALISVTIKHNGDWISVQGGQPVFPHQLPVVLTGQFRSTREPDGTFVSIGIGEMNDYWEPFAVITARSLDDEYHERPIDYRRVMREIAEAINENEEARRLVLNLPPLEANVSAECDSPRP